MVNGLLMGGGQAVVSAVGGVVDHYLLVIPVTRSNPIRPKSFD